MGAFSGLRQVNALRGVCGGDDVKRVVCMFRWEGFGCFIEEGAFWGIYFIHISYFQLSPEKPSVNTFDNFTLKMKRLLDCTAH